MMNPYYVGIIGIVCLFVFILLNLPIGIAMGLVGVLGICVLTGVETGLTFLGDHYFNVAATYVYGVLPLFITVGFLASGLRLSSDTFNALNKWIGHKRGGLAMASTMACGGFAAVCGDAISTAVTVASVALPDMRKVGYKDTLSLGCLAAGGNLGFIFPPSAALIIYAILTEQSVGTLFMAGIVPGILMIFMFMSTIWIMCKINQNLGPPTERSNWKERLKASKNAIGVALLIIIVLGGIYLGLFTPTEAGGVGVFGVIVIGIIYRRANIGRIFSDMHSSLILVGRVFILISGATFFSKFLVLSTIPLVLSDLLIHANISRILILIILLVFYMAVGFVMDIFAIILITAPILHPALVNLGFNPVWLSVIIVMTILMGNISPPFGIVVFGLKAFVPETPINIIFRGAIPFLLAMAVSFTLIIIFPKIALFLPGMMRPV